MKKHVLFILVLIFAAILDGCIVKATPDQRTTVVINPGSTQIFSVLPGAKSTYIWSLDGTTIAGAHHNNYSYTPTSSEIGTHILAVSMCLQWSTKTTVWTIRVVEASDDPGLPGSYKTLPLNYGCDPKRFPHAYTRNCPCDTDPQARTTDISAYLATPDWYVSSIRGIKMQAVPLHARGYMPVGVGPFPLVLVVHGNRMPWEISYYGYDYLTAHLASHGYIALAIEEDFLNGFIDGEIDARAIVILRHLQLLREWNQSNSGHPLASKIDMGAISLVGHSRGGEAVAAAWYLNTALHDPADPDHDFNFTIRSLCALAPTDGLFELDSVGKVTIELHDVDYFVMQGSHDGDVHGFQGMMMYDRAFDQQVNGSGEKAMLFIQCADHAGWNTVWARKGDPYSVRPRDPDQTLLPSGDQQAIGKTYITAWLNCTLRGNAVDRRIVAGETKPVSLPTGLVMNHAYQSRERVFIDHYEEDGDKTTATWTPASNTGTGLAIWDEVTLKTEREAACAPGQGHAVSLAWNIAGGVYRVTGIPKPDNPEVALYLDSLDNLSLRAGQVYEPAVSAYNPLPSANQDFTIRLIVAGVETAPVHVSDYTDLIPPLPIERSNYLAWYDATNTILDSVRIPLADFQPGLKASSIEGVELGFEGTGWIYLDDLQLTRW